MSLIALAFALVTGILLNCLLVHHWRRVATIFRSLDQVLRMKTNTESISVSLITLCNAAIMDRHSGSPMAVADPYLTNSNS